MRFTYQSGAQPLAGYTIQRGIHCGGFGEVYFAHSDGGKEVALKLLHRQDQDIEIRGVTQCLNLKHPNLVNLFDVKTDAHGDRWVVMEYVSGSSLEDVLASFPDGLPLSEVRDWLGGLVAGVAHLHERGIVHRDLKPANVYRENGVVKVGDVGLSKRLESDHRKAHTQSVGTVYYMAPEVARGQYGPEVDVYSLGVMLYELITGKVPFNGETTAEILMKHLTAQPDLNPIPKGLRPAVARALDKDPRKRTPTVRELERDFLKGLGQTPEPAEIPESSFLPPLPVPPPLTSTAGSRGYGPATTPDRVPAPQRNMANPSAHPASEVAVPAENNTAKILIVTLGLLLVFHRFRGIAPTMLEIMAIGFAIAYFSRKTPATGAQQPLPFTGTSPATAIPEARPRATRYSTSAGREPTARANLMADQPFWSVRWPLLAHALSAAAMLASLFSIAIYLLPYVTAPHPRLVFPTNESTVLFAATAIFGSWVFLSGHCLTSGSRWTNQQRWLTRIAAGAVIGSFAYGLQQFLMVTIPPNAFSTRAVMASIGDFPLAGPHLNPTWLGYCCFFGAWAGVRRWNREMDGERTRRLNLWSVVGAVFVAYLITVIFKFPQWYALLWAGTISTTVQLASRWQMGPRS